VDIENAGGGFDQRSQLMLTGLPGPLLLQPDQRAGKRRTSDREQRDQQIETMTKPDAHQIAPSKSRQSRSRCGDIRHIIVNTS
jgi:hypothetical protein